MTFWLALPQVMVYTLWPVMLLMVVVLVEPETLQEPSAVVEVVVFTLVPPTEGPVTVQAVLLATPVALQVMTEEPPDTTRVTLAEMTGVVGDEQELLAPLTVTGVQEVGPAVCVPLVAETVGA